MLDMARPRPPHLQRGSSRHGKTIWFVQLKRGAPKIRIRGEYGSPEFEAAYHAAIAASPPKQEIKAGKGTLEGAWLVKPASRR